MEGIGNAYIILLIIRGEGLVWSLVLHLSISHFPHEHTTTDYANARR